MRLRRNDRRDVDRFELMLMRPGQHLARLARCKASTISERMAFWEAAAIVWDAKRRYRAELADRRHIAGQLFAQRMREKVYA